MFRTATKFSGKLEVGKKTDTKPDKRREQGHRMRVAELKTRDFN